MIHLLGDRLKELRKRKNLTQEEFGKLFGVAKNTVSYWEANTSKPDINLIKEIAKYFNVTTDYLLDFNNDDKANLEKLKTTLKEAGIMNGDDLTIEEFEKALKIVEMLKDTNK